MGQKTTKQDRRKSRDDAIAMKLDELDCPKCSLIYKDPRLLDCAHTLCFDCCPFDKGKVVCPLCRRETFVETKGGLRVNNLVQREIEIGALLLSDKNAHILSRAGAKGTLRGPTGANTI